MATLTPDILKWIPYIDDPVGFCKNIIGIELDEWQEKFMRNIADPRNIRIAVKSCHGPGKTAVLALIILWWLCTRPYPRVACTAPAEHQLNDKLWPEVHKWMRKSKAQLDRWFQWEKTRVFLVGEHEEWFAVARVARVIKTASSSMGEAWGLQGFHSDHMLFIADESSGVNDAVYGAMEGAISTSTEVKIVAAGNPNVPSGWFYDAFKKQKDHWTTQTVTYLDSPRVSNEWAEDMIKMYGREHPWVKVKVFGEFPNSVEGGLLDLNVIEASRDRKEIPGPVTVGVDVARKKDKSVLSFASGANVYAIKGIEGMALTDLALEVYDIALDIEADNIVVDADGMGITVVDELAKLLKSNPSPKKPRLIEWHGSASPNEKNRYINARAELCWKLKGDLEAIHGKVRIIESEDFDIEACVIQYETDERTGKITIASKKKIRKIINKSPDTFDAVTYSLVPFLYGDEIPLVGGLTAEELIG